MERYREDTLRMGCLQIPVCDKSITGELSGDFTLPDYQPEIKRLLKISASVLPASTYFGNSSASFEGSVDYYVTYMGGDNEIYCAPISTEYRLEAPLDNELDAEELSGYASISPDMVSGRVISPRKLNVKCRLRGRAKVYGELTVEDGFGDGAEVGTEILRGCAELGRVLVTSGEVIHLTDEMINDRADGEVRVVSADGKSLMSEVACADGYISCRGELYLKLLLRAENRDAPYIVWRKLPFSQNLYCEGITQGCSAYVKGTVCEMSINAEDGRVSIDVGLILEGIITKLETVEFIKDAYATDRNLICHTKDVGATEANGCIMANFTQSDSQSLEEAGISPSSTLVDICGSASIDEYGYDGGRIRFIGKAKYSVICEKDGEYSVNDVELPFKYEVEGNADDALAFAEAVNLRARIDGERIGIDAEISLCGHWWRNSRQRILDSVSFGDEYEERGGDCIICYPSSDDSLWSVAKRYGAPLDDIRDINQLSSEHAADDKASLEGAKYIVIK